MGLASSNNKHRLYYFLNVSFLSIGGFLATPASSRCDLISVPGRYKLYVRSWPRLGVPLGFCSSSRPAWRRTRCISLRAFLGVGLACACGFLGCAGSSPNLILDVLCRWALFRISQCLSGFSRFF